MRSGLFIGEVSKSTGASPKAIRLYEALGLLTRIPRQGRYRIYDQSDIEFIKLIKEAQSLGITLSDLKSLVVGRNRLNWQSVIHLLGEKEKIAEAELASIRYKQERMERYRKNIQSCLDNYVDSAP